MKTIYDTGVSLYREDHYIRQVNIRNLHKRMSMLQERRVSQLDEEIVKGGRGKKRKFQHRIQKSQ